MILFTRRGEQGVPGPSGPGLTYSEGVPSDGDGDDGDSCVDTTHKHLYRKMAGAWVFTGALASTVTDVAAKFICPDTTERTATLTN